MLDSFQTVKEPVTELRKEAFRTVSVIAPNDIEAKIQRSISDLSGDSAIFEYMDGKLVTHHGRPFQVLTDSPTNDQQRPLNEHWKQIGETVILSETNCAANRLARVSSYINAAPEFECWNFTAHRSLVEIIPTAL